MENSFERSTHACGEKAIFFTGFLIKHSLLNIDHMSSLQILGKVELSAYYSGEIILEIKTHFSGQ